MIPDNLKSFLELTTPQYIAFYVLGTFFSYVIISRNINFATLIPSIIALSITILGLNSINMVFDAKLDKINKPKRPIPSGRIKKTTATIISIVLCAIGLVISSFTNVLAFTLVTILIISFLIYTHPKVYLKKYFWSSPLFGGIFYGAIPYLTAWSQTSQSINPIFLVFYCLLIASIAPIKDIEDIKGERKYKIKSIPQIIGAKTTVEKSSQVIFTLITIMLIFSILGVINSKYLIASIISYFLVIITFRTVLKIIKKEKVIITQSKSLSALMIAIMLIYGLYAAVSIF